VIVKFHTARGDCFAWQIYRPLIAYFFRRHDMPLAYCKFSQTFVNAKAKFAENLRHGRWPVFANDFASMGMGW
jgi:hypothetical protein